MRPESDFETLAAYPDPPVEELALAVAAELREPDRDSTLVQLDRLGEQLAVLASGGGGPDLEAWACAEVLGGRHGLAGDREDYDNPDNSMLDLVLERRRGLPILLALVYVEVARRAEIQLAGVGLPGHYVAGHFGCDPPLLVDAFAGGAVTIADRSPLVRPWPPHETALRMLNNLVGSYATRGDLGRAIRCAELRLVLPTGGELREGLEVESRALRARLN
jgi:regulator of sirC expression with transglutaminase-like and TPR domain